MRRLLWLLLPCALAAGCTEEDDERPPAFPECPASDPACDPVRPPPVASFGGTPSTGGTAGGQEGGSGGVSDAGSGGAADVGLGGEDGEGGAAEAVEIEGSVAEYVDDGFILTRNYTRDAIIEAAGVDQRQVSATWNGSDPFVLRVVRNERPIWLSVRPEADTGLELRTLHPIIHGASAVVLPIIDRVTIGQLVFGLLPSLPLLDDERAQAVIFFRGDDRRTLNGLIAELPAAAVIAYARGGGWTEEDALGTDASGLVVLGNITARSYPGADVRIGFRGAREGYADIRIAAGAVTVADVVIR